MDYRSLDPRDKGSILESLAEVLPLFYAALEGGAGRTREFFATQTTERGKRRDPYLAAHLTRYWAGLHLAEHGIAARIDPIWLPNSGLAVRHKDFDIRCLKAFEGGVPGPGRSQAKRAFYHQVIQQHLFLFEPDQERDPAMVNLIMTWDVDGKGNLGRLDLHCPEYVSRWRDEVHCYWSEPLMHPAETYESEERTAAEEQAEDLPYYEEERPGADEETGAG